MTIQFGLRGKALQWFVEAQEEQVPVQVAEEFEHWSVQDEDVVGLMLVIGREQWEKFQDVVYAQRA